MEKLETSVCIWKARNRKDGIRRRTTTAARLLWCEQYCVCIYCGSLLLVFCNNEDTRLILLHQQRGFDITQEIAHIVRKCVVVEQYFLFKQNSQMNPKNAACSFIHVSRFILLLLGSSQSCVVFFYFHIITTRTRE